MKLLLSGLLLFFISLNANALSGSGNGDFGDQLGMVLELDTLEKVEILQNQVEQNIKKLIEELLIQQDNISAEIETIKRNGEISKTTRVKSLLSKHMETLIKRKDEEIAGIVNELEALKTNNPFLNEVKTALTDYSSTASTEELGHILLNICELNLQQCASIYTLAYPNQKRSRRYFKSGNNIGRIAKEYTKDVLATYSLVEEGIIRYQNKGCAYDPIEYGNSALSNKLLDVDYVKALDFAAGQGDKPLLLLCKSSFFYLKPSISYSQHKHKITYKVEKYGRGMVTLRNYPDKEVISLLKEFTSF